MIGVKSNQAHLHRYCLCSSLINNTDYERSDEPQVGHGRVEQRTYGCFAVSPLALAPRWKDAGMRTLIRVQRIRQKLAGSQLTQEVNYFLSNAQPTNQSEADELFDAIRHHWRVEPGRRSGDASSAGRNLS